MANSYVTDLRYQSQFKDYVSAKERLLICGIKNSSFEKSPKKLTKKKTDRNDVFGCGNFGASKTVLA